MVNSKGKMKKVLGSVLAACISVSCFAGLTGCGNTVNTPPDNTDPVEQPEEVKVTEVTLELDKTTAKVGETVKATVKIRPSNATNKNFVISSADDTVAKVGEDGTSISCLKQGSVTIIARAKADPTKKAEVTLVVLGTDEQGRCANLFEAEEATLVPYGEGSGLRVEVVSDTRITGTGVVGSLSKGDRIIWGVDSDEDDKNASLTMKLMGPSGWVSYWDSIPYNFADWYTVKVNGKVIDTEDIHVEGTENKASAADYYAVKEVEIGSVSLNKGLNVITFSVSNRYDQTAVNQGEYKGNINCIGNVDSITVYSSKNLTFVKDTQEVADAEPDVNPSSLMLQAEADKTRVYESKDVPKVDVEGSFVEFKPDMNVMFGLKADRDMLVQFRLKVAAPYLNAHTPMTDVALNKMISLTVNGVQIDVSSLAVKGNDVIGGKENYTEVTTGWVNLAEGNNALTVFVKRNADYEYLGGLDCVGVSYFTGDIQAYLVEEPQPVSTLRLETEAETTKRVGYEALEEGASWLTLKDAIKVETDKYNNKLETTKVIYGIEAASDTYATLTMRFAAPLADDIAKEVTLGSLGDLWVNGKMVSTPNTIKCDGNFAEIEIEAQVSLRQGKNRIAWEPKNYTDNNFADLGRLDYVEVTSAAELSPYTVNFWTDRYTYFDDNNNEPIWVTCDKVSDSTPNNSWIAVYRADDSIESNQPGSLYWYYPAGSSWNSVPVALGEKTNILAQNPNSQRPLISGATGGFYVVVYMEKDSVNANGGYDVVDYITIGVWDDPDAGYGGYVNA